MSDPSSPLPRDPAPSSLVHNGEYRFGTYDGPIAHLNPEDSVKGSGAAGWLGRTVRTLRMKEWQAFQLGNDEWFVLGAVYDAKFVALLQVLAVHKESGRIHRWEKKIPSLQLSVARGLDGTRSHGRTGDFAIALGNEVSLGRLTVDATHPGDGAGLPALELHGVGHCAPDLAAHLVIAHPFADGRSLYSDKCMMPFGGTLRIGDQDVSFDTDSSFMILDDHHGEYPSPLQYDWLTGARRTAEGTLQGFNLTANQIQDPERYNENAIWIDNTVHRLPAVRFERPNGVNDVWLVTDAHGQVDVRFTPTVRSEMHVGPRKILAEYFAPYGWFEGRLAAADGATLDLDGFFGVGEQKLIRL
ncbi:hypothetical protein BH10ACT3_BH10ACT3_18000 [soil metagenome]